LRKLVVSEFISVDGVMEDPGGAEKSPRGGWALQFNRGDEGDRMKLDELMSADALVLGRKTYEGFASAWPGRTDEAGFAEKMNSMPKYVVSRTLTKPTWDNTTLISGDAVGAIARLKEQPGGELLVNGSCDLVHTLIQNDLVDEMRLMVFPIVLGSGRRLFSDSPHVWPFRLIDVRAVGKDGVLIVRYEPKRIPEADERRASWQSLNKAT
jgi:dihydrofolate reductase